MDVGKEKSKNEEDLTEDKLEEMLATQFSKQINKKHRGYGGYERKALHRRPKAEKKEN
ncbi:hypothetical protein [Methanohalophilus sp.]|uniref:hypothetical protein n=1 Tax=Methanohalophilus sp. TaxID=1966352 RepID=UPI00262636DA|nr:hypothetical protein [Methanohalophilus sp.]MDK2892128.1 hypothetical protein [Methanohalophilus sp.]